MSKIASCQLTTLLFVDKFDQDFQSFVIEEAVSKSYKPIKVFDWQEFLALSNIKDRTDVDKVLFRLSEYLYSTMQNVGSGTSREVFKFPGSEAFVVKLAKNKAGIAQNAKEKAISSEYPDILSKVSNIERSKFNLWIVSENVEQIGNITIQFEKQFGFPMGYFQAYVLVAMDHTGGDFDEALKILSNPNYLEVDIPKRLWQKVWGLYDKLSEEEADLKLEMQKRVRKFLITMIGSKEVNDLIELSMNKHGMSLYDMIKLDSWGVSSYDGKVKLLDYGLDYKIFSKFYSVK